MIENGEPGARRYRGPDRINDLPRIRIGKGDPGLDDCGALPARDMFGYDADRAIDQRGHQYFIAGPKRHRAQHGIDSVRYVFDQRKILLADGNALRDKGRRFVPCRMKRVSDERSGRCFDFAQPSDAVGQDFPRCYAKAAVVQIDNRIAEREGFADVRGKQIDYLLLVTARSRRP